jgi:hypothetical protein
MLGSATPRPTLKPHLESELAMSDELEEPTSPQALFMAAGTLATCATLLLLIASFW